MFQGGERPATTTLTHPPAAAAPVAERIEDITVGTNVLAENPLGDEDFEFGAEVDPFTWRRLRLRAAKEDGSYADVELLRPAWWLEEQEAAVGRSIELSVPECGIEGQAEILAIAHCPPLAPPKPGYRTVTGTFKHYSAHVFDLALSGLDAPIGTTGNHPFYSLDRAEFVRADELMVGERLKAASGAVTVVALVERPLPSIVHNLEVQVDHVYQGWQQGRLATGATQIFGWSMSNRGEQSGPTRY